MVGIIDRTEGAAQYIFKQRAKGLGYRQIARGLKANFGLSVSHMTVKNFIENKSGDMQYLIQGNNELKEETEELVKETVRELKILKKRMWELLDKVDYKGDSRAMVQTASEIRKILETQERIMDVITNPRQTTNVNISDLNLRIENVIQNNFIAILQKLEKRGLIKIKGTESELKSSL